MCRDVLRRLYLLGALVAFSTRATALAATKPPLTAKVKLLYCENGSIGLMPFSPPPEFESQFAVAVVEIDSPTKAVNAAVSDFALVDRDGKTIALKRVMKVEEFDDYGIATGNGLDAHYRESRKTRPWDGTIRAGRMRLRIRVALDNGPGEHPERCRLTVDRYVIEGPLNESEPSS